MKDVKGRRKSVSLSQSVCGLEYENAHAMVSSMQRSMNCCQMLCVANVLSLRPQVAGHCHDAGGSCFAQDAI